MRRAKLRPRIGVLDAVGIRSSVLRRRACYPRGCVPGQLRPPSRPFSVGVPWVLGLVLSSFVPVRPARAAAVGEATAGTSERTWVTHEILPGETYEDIGARYGVSKKEILRWNAKRLGPKKWLIAGKKLRIYARRVPPAPVLSTYVVRKGDTYAKIAAKFGMREEALRRLNRRSKGRGKKLYVGQTLRVYVQPEPPQPPADAGPLPEFSVPAGSYAHGKPNRGRLIGGVQVTSNDDFTVRNPDRAYATSHAALVLRRAMADFRRRSGYRGTVLVADISKRGGGRLRPHRSHQTGRDIDIRLPKLEGIPAGKYPSMDEIDWVATWHMVAAFVDTGEVEYIFLDYRRQRRLYRAARRLGVSEDRLRQVMQYPRGPKATQGIVRHSKGHTIHMHVRIKCAEDAPSCVSY